MGDQVVKLIPGLPQRVGLHSRAGHQLSASPAGSVMQRQQEVMASDALSCSVCIAWHCRAGRSQPCPGAALHDSVESYDAGLDTPKLFNLHSTELSRVQSVRTAVSLTLKDTGDCMSLYCPAWDVQAGGDWNIRDSALLWG